MRGNEIFAGTSRNLASLQLLLNLVARARGDLGSEASRCAQAVAAAGSPNTVTLQARSTRARQAKHNLCTWLAMQAGAHSCGHRRVVRNARLVPRSDHHTVCRDLEASSELPHVLGMSKHWLRFSAAQCPARVQSIGRTKMANRWADEQLVKSHLLVGALQ